jgi:light-regulated signal transduction histidine kinase (bacteriophytochrome)
VEIIYVNFVYEAYLEADSSITGVLAVAVDVTAQVIAHQKIEEEVSKRTHELAEANSNLQKSNSELAQFAYIASHDLQEPLRKITTFSQMLEDALDGNIDEQAQKYLDKIKTSTSKMTTLIRDVLAYSELARGTDQFTTVDLEQVIKNTITDYELLIEQKGASVTWHNLPVIDAIPLQMSQLFGNIVGNALKFARKDIKPVIDITTSKASSGDIAAAGLDPSLNYVKISFADNGIGFEEEHAVKVFKIFQRLHRKSEYEGTGIGLAMCKKIALNHGGDINATGSAGNGAIFNVILPVKHV